MKKNLSLVLLVVAAFTATANAQIQHSDINGDGRDEIAVFRPSNGYWYFQDALTGALLQAEQYGQAGDKIEPADYDGDGKIDLGVFRPSALTHYIRKSINFSSVGVSSSDISSDPNAKVNPCDRLQRTIGFQDFTEDIGVFSGGEFRFRNLDQSLSSKATLGNANDIPVSGMYNGLAQPCIAAVYRSSAGTYYLEDGRSMFVGYGIPDPKDYDGDGKTDPAVFTNDGFLEIRGFTGTNQSIAFGAYFGQAIPASADFDGDGRDNPAIFIRDTGQWRWIDNTGSLRLTFFGQFEDIPVSGYLGLNQ